MSQSSLNSNKSDETALNLLNMESEDPKSSSSSSRKRGRPQSLYSKSSEQTQRRKRAQIYANAVELGGNHEEAIHLLQSTLRQRSFFLSENLSILETLVRNIQWILSNSSAPNPFKSILGGLLTKGLTLTANCKNVVRFEKTRLPLTSSLFFPQTKQKQLFACHKCFLLNDIIF
jgi:hypothetical protein